MKRSLSLVISTLLIVLLLPRCSSNPTGPVEGELPRDLTNEEIQLIQADNHFGLKLFRAVCADTGDVNIFVSPLSVAMALGMTLNGAAGETYTAMQQTLELAGLNEEQLNRSYQSLIQLLTNLDRRVTVGIANSIWYRESYPISQEFVDVSMQYFDAEVSGLDFSSSNAVDIINNWVDQKTRGKITEIVENIGGDIIMCLINAIYFEGKWTFRFDPALTREAEFHLLDGSTVPVQMMSIEDVELPYYVSSQFESVDLPYGNQLYCMTIILPRQSTNLDTLIDQLTSEAWDAWNEARYKQEFTRFEMPKFSLEFEIQLNRILEDLGMGIAFGAGADFRRMNEAGIPDLWIDEVKHKTFIEVDEEGTTAAAVTSVSMARSMPPIMVVDRPFIFAIRERQSGTILFIGKFLEPPPA